jgi:putative nucleotidyltransferase with HDIG domain
MKNDHHKRVRRVIILVGVILALGVLFVVQGAAEEADSAFTAIRDFNAFQLAGLGVLAVIGVYLFIFTTYRFGRDKGREKWMPVFAFGVIIAAFFFVDTVLVHLALSALDIPVAVSALLVPAAFFTIGVALRWGQGSAILTGLACALLAALGRTAGGGTAFDFRVFASVLAAGLSAAFLVHRISRKGTFIRAGAASGLLGALGTAAWAMLLFQNPEGSVSGVWPALKKELVANAIAVVPGLAAGLVYYILLGPIETVLNLTTDVRLHSFSDQGHRVLRKMAEEVPGTYHHCQTVGHLAFAAAEAIGANALLARVGAYYHDIGKMKRPDYFIENLQTGIDKQQKYSPEKGAAIILNHTTDGRKYGRRYRLPPKVVDIILQHQGTALVQGFYKRALRDAASKGRKPDKERFRYKGPRPRSPEAAIVMICDSVEAASRSVKNPTPEKMRELVDEVVNAKITEDQLAESGLEFGQVEIIKDVLARQLLAIFHNRMEHK